jgi:hypothetical protein
MKESVRHLLDDKEDVQNISLLKHQNQVYAGGVNKAIRCYWYVKSGLDIVNEFRYIVMAVLGIYFALRLDNYIYLIILFLSSIPILLFLGWVNVHFVQKVMEFLNLRHTTVWGKYSMELNERQTAALEKIAGVVKDKESL